MSPARRTRCTRFTPLSLALGAALAAIAPAHAQNADTGAAAPQATAAELDQPVASGKKIYPFG